MAIISLLFGLGLAVLVFLSNYLTVRWFIRTKGILSVLILISKYFVYWKLLSFGLDHFPIWGVVVGFTVGLYACLIALYLMNKRKSGKDSD